MPNRAAQGGGAESVTPPRVCECLLCVRSRGWQSRKAGTKAQLLKLVDEIQNELCSAEFELDCLQHLNPSEATVHNVRRREDERRVIEQARLWAATKYGKVLISCAPLANAVRALEAGLKGDAHA